MKVSNLLRQSKTVLGN